MGAAVPHRCGETPGGIGAIVRPGGAADLEARRTTGVAARVGGAGVRRAEDPRIVGAARVQRALRAPETTAANPVGKGPAITKEGRAHHAIGADRREVRAADRLTREDGTGAVIGIMGRGYTADGAPT